MFYGALEALAWLVLIFLVGVIAYGLVIWMLDSIRARRIRHDDAELAQRLNREAEQHFRRGLGVALLAVLVMAQKCPQSVCATGEQLATGADGLVHCVCKPEHVKDEDGVGCHREESPTTTTTSTTTTTTTSTSTTSTTTTIPGPVPTPTPCVPDPPMPSGPVDVRGGLKPSSCETPGENRRCFKGGAGGSDVRWEADENACWPAWAVAEQGRVPRVLGGIALMCEPGYLTDADDTSRGCFDSFGRRYKWDGGAWREQVLADRFSGWWFGICPPRVQTCEPTPTPTPNPDGTCALPAMPECGRAMTEEGHYGCCWTDKYKPLPASPFGETVDQVQAEIERELPGLFDQDGRVEETAYVEELVRRLRSRGHCASRGGPSDEVGIKASNAESFQYDVHLSNGRPRLYGYVAYCSPARH